MSIDIFDIPRHEDEILFITQYDFKVIKQEKNGTSSKGFYSEAAVHLHYDIKAML